MRKALMVTVEVDPERVESRLAGGELSCPSCPDGVLVRWGFAAVSSGRLTRCGHAGLGAVRVR